MATVAETANGSAQGASTFTDPILTRAVLSGVENGFRMCALKTRWVGLSVVPSRDTGLITGMIGVHGKVSGFVTVNVSERIALRAVEGLIGDKFERLTPQVIDGTGELTNIIVGGIKSALGGTTWALSQITVPSVIVGQGYQIAFARGLEFMHASFEVEDADSFMLDERLVHVSMSLLRL